MQLTEDAGFTVNVPLGVGTDLKDVSYVTSCKFMHSQNSGEIEVAFSGIHSDKTYIFDVTQYMKKPIEPDAFQKGNPYKYGVLLLVIVQPWGAVSKFVIIIVDNFKLSIE